MAKRFDRCIGGYAGCGNMGDDAILQAYLDGLSAGERKRTVVLSGFPRRDRRRFGVRCVGRKRFFAVVCQMLQSRTFLLGGGSLLQNGTGNLSLLYYLGLLRLARLCGCKTEILAGGIGPLKGKWARRAVLRELQKCRFIRLRDANSVLLLKEWGISPSKIALVDDPALHLSPPPPTRRLFLLQKIGFYPYTSYCNVILRAPFAQNADFVNVIADSLRLVKHEKNVLPLFLMLDPKRDGAITEQVCREVGGRIVSLRDASDALAIISGARFLISMRLHGLIFAQTVGVAALAISPSADEPKLAAFCLERDVPHLTSDQVSVGEVVGSVRGL